MTNTDLQSLKSEEKLLAGFSHILIFFHVLGLVANLVIYLVSKEKSPFIARHARQALGVQIGSIAFTLVLGAAGVGMGLGFVFGGMFSPLSMAFLGGIVGLAIAALAILFLVCIIIAAVKGFSGQEYRYPIIGEFVDSIG